MAEKAVPDVREEGNVHHANSIPLILRSATKSTNSNSNSCKELSALCKVDAICAVCMCEVGEEEDALFCNKWCSEQHDEACSCHIECMQYLIESVLNSAFPGSCPVISCPCLHQRTKKSSGHNSPVQSNSNNVILSPRGSFVAEYPQTTFIVPYSTWSTHMNNVGMESLVLKHKQLAANLMPFLCSSCHMQRSIQENYACPDVPAPPNVAPGNTTVLPRKRTDLEEVLDWQPHESMLQAVRRNVHSMQYVNHNSFEATMRMYLSGRISVNDFYRFLSQACFGSSQTVPFPQFRLVLMLIEDPERRNNLHLRYLRDHREFLTLCCEAKHCWTCKSRPHPHISCEQNNNNLDSDIIECNSCGISLAKGDGCDALRCVCGNSLNWAAEKKAYGLSMQFAESYPFNTILACAVHMYDVPLQALASDEADGDEAVTPDERTLFMSALASARAFRHKNTRSVNELLLQLFAKENGLYRMNSALKGAGAEKTLARRFLLAKRSERKNSQQAAALRAADESIPLLGLELDPVIPGAGIDKFYAHMLPTQIVATKMSRGDPRILLDDSSSPANLDTIATHILGSESAARLWFEQHKRIVLLAIREILTAQRCILDAYYGREDNTTHLVVKGPLSPVTISTAVVLEHMQRPHLRAIDDPYGYSQEPYHLLANSLSSAARKLSNSSVKAHEATQASNRVAVFSRFFGNSKVLETNKMSETGRSLLPYMRTRLYNLWNKTYEVLCEADMTEAAMTESVTRWEEKVLALHQPAVCDDDASDVLLRTLACPSHMSLLSLLMNHQVAPSALDSATQSELAGINSDLVQTWNDVWDSSIYAIQHVFISRKRGEEDIVQKFEEEFGGSALMVAAHACYETSTRRRAVAYMQAKPQEMQEWYQADMSSGDPLIAVRWGCRCLPRHLNDQLCYGVHREGAAVHEITNLASAFRNETLADCMTVLGAQTGAPARYKGPLGSSSPFLRRASARSVSVAADAAAMAHHSMWPNEPVNVSSAPTVAEFDGRVAYSTRELPYFRPTPPPAPPAAHSRQVAANFNRDTTITTTTPWMETSSRAVPLMHSLLPPAPMRHSPPSLRPTIVASRSSLRPSIVPDAPRVSSTAVSRDALLSAIVGSRLDLVEGLPPVPSPIVSVLLQGLAARSTAVPAPLRTGSHWTRPPPPSPLRPRHSIAVRDTALSPAVRSSSVSDLIARFETRSSAWRTIRDSSAPIQDREAARRQITQVARNSSPRSMRGGFNSPFEHVELDTPAPATVSLQITSRGDLLSAIRRTRRDLHPSRRI